MKKSVTRLFGYFHPENYKLDLTLNPENLTFAGTVIITGLKIGKPSKRLILHAKDLKVENVSVVRNEKGKSVDLTIDRINYLKTRDELRLHSTQMLYPGKFKITITFKGKITSPMNGLYPCHFELKGQKKILLATQFESHHAREVFPCIDEPEAKATFDVRLQTPADFGIAISNAPLLSKKINNGTLISDFETTPIMSTYLLAFVVGEINYKETTTTKGTIVRTYATPENVAHLDFALDTARRCLEFYEDYFRIPYPLPKCDMVALPDFASGAMENWGLITYREQALLVDPNNTSLATKQHVAMVVAHELAHMWFGNLVTMRWWTDLWLNEGFASWIEYLAVDHLFPDWGMWTQFIVDEQAYGLKLDALEHTHPVEVPINHPDEIRTIFDAISYQKGSSVIHMLHNYLGAEAFRDGLRHYLKRHAYSNTDTVDLWAALEEISKKPVRSFMHAWTSQPGYPILKVTLKNTEIQLEQERFYLNPAQKRVHNNWPIPLLTNKTLPKEQISDRKEVLTIKTLQKLVIFNFGHRGFYRTVYDSNYVNSLAKSIATLSAEDRLGLLSDAFEAAKGGYYNTVDALHLLDAYREETHASVWDIIATNVGDIRRIMDDKKIRELLKPFVQQLIFNEYLRLGWEEQPNESHFDKLQRPMILSLGAGADHPDILSEIEKRFANMKKSADLHPDIRGVIYTTVARRGGEKEFTKLLTLHDTSNNAEERVTLAAALTNFKQKEHIEKALSFIKTDRVRLQDISYWLVYSFMNRHAKEYTWQWLTTNWQWLQENLGNDLSFYRTPVYAARCFSNEAFLDEFKKFFEPKKTPALERSINQGIEILEWQIAWKKRDLKAIRSFIEKYCSS